MGKFNRFEEDHLLKVAGQVCGISEGDILLIGGGLTLPRISGFKRLRPRSDDLDFIANSRGFHKAEELSFFKKWKYRGDNLCAGEIEDVLVALFPGTIRGYGIPDEVYERAVLMESSHGRIYTVEEELNIAMKIRRGVHNHFYGKDRQDFVSMSLARHYSGNPLNVELWMNYMTPRVCDDCTLNSPLACIENLGSNEGNLKENEKIAFKRVKRKFKKVENLCKFHAKNKCWINDV